MNIKRSILSFAITAVMIFTLIPVSAFAENQYKPATTSNLAVTEWYPGKSVFSSPSDLWRNLKVTVRVNDTGNYPYHYYWTAQIPSGKKFNVRYAKTKDNNLNPNQFNPLIDVYDTLTYQLGSYYNTNKAYGITYPYKSYPIGQSYLYVEIYDSNNNYKKYGYASIYVNYPMAKPKITSIKKKSKTSIKIKWSRISNATGYLIYQSTGKSWKCIKTITKNTTLTYTKKKLKKGKKYYYCVRPYKTKGNTIKGPYSKYKSKKL